MENTGRINRTVKSELREILYGKNTGLQDPELQLGAEVDKAHIVMLNECGLIKRSSASALLSAIEKLIKNEFKELMGRDNARGSYISYEDYLIEIIGMENAGGIQLGRSRNDRNAAVTKLHVRNLFVSLMRELFKLQDSLIEAALKYSKNVMPAFTHYQAAQPVVLGHYLAGISSAISKDVTNLLIIVDELNESVLGAGAIAGTHININTQRTAELLGFSSASNNSTDAIASRDYILRILSAMAIIGSTLSRYSTDLLSWSTVEFNMINFPDELVGASSMMPQKRNAFILEHIQGKSAKALGGFVAAITAQQSTPFSNSIAVNSAAVSNFWSAVKEITDSIILTRFMTEGIIPNAERMLQLAEEGLTIATAAADKLTILAGIPFREAHKIIGAIIKEIFDGPSNEKSKLFAAKLKADYPQINWDDLTPEKVAAASNFGGGPGIISLNNCLDDLSAKLAGQKKEFEKYESFWNESSKKLAEAVNSITKLEE